MSRRVTPRRQFLKLSVRAVQAKQNPLWSLSLLDGALYGWWKRESGVRIYDAWIVLPNGVVRNRMMVDEFLLEHVQHPEIILRETQQSVDNSLRVVLLTS